MPSGKGGYLLNAERRSKGRGDGWGDPDNNPGESSRASNHAVSESESPTEVSVLTDNRGLESGPMNEFGEPNMGNPSVRFDEGRERVGHWPLAFQSNRSCLLYETERHEVV